MTGCSTCAGTGAPIQSDASACCGGAGRVGDPFPPVGGLPAPPDGLTTPFDIIACPPGGLSGLKLPLPPLAADFGDPVPAKVGIGGERDADVCAFVVAVPVTT